MPTTSNWTKTLKMIGKSKRSQPCLTINLQRKEQDKQKSELNVTKKEEASPAISSKKCVRPSRKKTRKPQRTFCQKHNLHCIRLRKLALFKGTTLPTKFPAWQLKFKIFPNKIANTLLYFIVEGEILLSQQVNEHLITTFGQNFPVPKCSHGMCDFIFVP